MAEFLADPPSLGVWTDWAPNIHGSITLGKDCAGRLVVRWNEVPYFGQGAVPPYSSFDIAFDPSTQIWSLENLTGLSASAAATAMLIGICPGNVAPGPGTNPGAQDYTLGLGSAANASDALYQFGTANTLGLPGGLLSGAGPINPVNSINFLPNGSGAYNWFSL